MMSDKKVLVTGAAGFIGSHVVDALLGAGNAVVGFDIAPLEENRNLNGVKLQQDFRYVQGDIRDPAALKQAFKKDIEIVFHLASIVGVNKYVEDPFLLSDVTVGGTRTVAQLALEHGTRILYTSTSEVYGRNPKVPWAEDDDRVLGSTQVDRWSYATSKAYCEHLLLGLYRMKKVPVTIVRYFNVYGPRQNPIFVISQSVYNVLRNEQPLLYDGGKQTRCFTYVDDAIKGTIAAAESSKAVGEVFNIGNGTETSIKDAVELTIKLSGKEIAWKNLDTRRHYGKAYEDIERRVPDVRKAKNVLGWEANVEAAEGIKQMIEWARDNSWWLEDR